MTLVVKTVLEGGNIAAECQVAVPALALALEDYYGAAVASDSVTAIIAGVNLDETRGLTSTQGTVEVVQNGAASFDKLAFNTNHKTVELSLVFSAPALPLVDSTQPLSVSVSMPSKPAKEKNKLGAWRKGFMFFLAVFNFMFAAACAAWTFVYKDRVIVALSQPKSLNWLCGGCVISTMSSVAPLYGSSNLSCQPVSRKTSGFRGFSGRENDFHHI